MTTTQTYLSGIDGGRLFTQAEMDAVEARHAETMERGARAMEAHVLRRRAAEQDAGYSATLLASVRRDIATALNGTAPRDALEDIARLLDAERAEPAPPRATTPTHRCACGFEGDFSAVMAHGVTERHAFGPVAVMGERPRATTPRADQPYTAEQRATAYGWAKQCVAGECPFADAKDREMAEVITRYEATLGASLAGSPSRDSGALLDDLISAARRAATERQHGQSDWFTITEYDAAMFAARAAVDRHIASLERDTAQMREALEVLAKMESELPRLRASSAKGRSMANGVELAIAQFRAALTPSGEPTTKGDSK